MKSMTVLLVLCIISVYYVANGELDANSARKAQNKKDYKFKEKDLKLAKARWISLQEEDWGDDMMQKPIDEPPRRTNRELGEMCTYSRDCGSACCLLDRSTKVRSCQPRAVKGEKCSNAQIKADIYVDACPCVSGYNFCSFPSEICSK